MCAFLQTPHPKANSSPVGGCLTCNGHSSPSNWEARGPAHNLISSKTDQSRLRKTYRPDRAVDQSLTDWSRAENRRGTDYRNGWYQNKRTPPQSNSSDICTLESRRRVWGTFAPWPRHYTLHTLIRPGRICLRLLRHIWLRHHSKPREEN